MWLVSQKKVTKYIKKHKNGIEKIITTLGTESKIDDIQETIMKDNKSVKYVNDLIKKVNTDYNLGFNDMDSLIVQLKIEAKRKRDEQQQKKAEQQMNQNELAQDLSELNDIQESNDNDDRGMLYVDFNFSEIKLLEEANSKINEISGGEVHLPEELSFSWEDMKEKLKEAMKDYLEKFIIWNIIDVEAHDELSVAMKQRLAESTINDGILKQVKCEQSIDDELSQESKDSSGDSRVTM